MMAPHYEAAASSLQGKVRFFKLNSDQEPSAAAQFNIRGVPTLIGWDEGRQVVSQPGAQTGPALEAWIRNVFRLNSSAN
jgi:thioredoxin 2